MKVKELIELLHRCNPEDVVMYNVEAELYNESLLTMRARFLDDVMIGTGICKGFVFLTADRLEG